MNELSSIPSPLPLADVNWSQWFRDLSALHRDDRLVLLSRGVQFFKSFENLFSYLAKALEPEQVPLHLKDGFIENETWRFSGEMFKNLCRDLERSAAHFTNENEKFFPTHVPAHQRPHDAALGNALGHQFSPDSVKLIQSLIPVTEGILKSISPPDQGVPDDALSFQRSSTLKSMADMMARYEGAFGRYAPTLSHFDVSMTVASPDQPQSIPALYRGELQRIYGQIQSFANFILPLNPPQTRLAITLNFLDHQLYRDWSRAEYGEVFSRLLNKAPLWAPALLGLQEAFLAQLRMGPFLDLFAEDRFLGPLFSDALLTSLLKTLASALEGRILSPAEGLVLLRQQILLSAEGANASAAQLDRVRQIAKLVQPNQGERVLNILQASAEATKQTHFSLWTDDYQDMALVFVQRGQKPRFLWVGAKGFFLKRFRLYASRHQTSSHASSSVGYISLQYLSNDAENRLVPPAVWFHADNGFAAEVRALDLLIEEPGYDGDFPEAPF